MFKVLLIDDDPLLVRMYQKKLENDGFEVIVANEGKSGVIQATKEQPDFILLDLLMPGGMDGVTALGHLRKIPETKDIPVAILSALSVEVPKKTTDPALEDKVVVYWQKDKYKPKQIAEMIKEYLTKGDRNG